MYFWIGFGIGFCLGTWFGMLISSLLIASGSEGKQCYRHNADKMGENDDQCTDEVDRNEF